MRTLLLIWLVVNFCVLAVCAIVWAREMLRSGAKGLPTNTKGLPTNTIGNEREDLEVLLPWHAAGTLNRYDADGVEKALAGDRELARRLDLAREELNETIFLNETLGAPSARAMERLFAAIDAEPARKPKASSFAGRLVVFVSTFSPRMLAWVGLAAVLAIILQVGVIVSIVVKNATGQGTELASVGVTDGSLAIIRFAPKADAVEITKFFELNNVSVVDGPKSGGIYTIRLPVTGSEKNDLVKRIQARSAIVEFIASVQ